MLHLHLSLYPRKEINENHAPDLQQRFGPPDLLSCRVCVDRRLMEYVMLQQAGAVAAVAGEGDAGTPGEGGAE